MKFLFFSLILGIMSINQAYGGYTAEFIFGDDTNTSPITKPVTVKSINLKTAKIKEIKIGEEIVEELKGKVIYPGQILKIKISDIDNNNFITLQEEDDLINKKIGKERVEELFQSIIFETEKEDIPFSWTQRSSTSLYFQNYSDKFSWNTFMRSLPRFNKRNNAYHHNVECSFLEQK